MIYNKQQMFLMKMYNNIKGKPKAEVEAFLEQLPAETRTKVAGMLISFYKKKIS